MNVEIRARGFSVTPGLREHVERRLAFALDRYEQRIARVKVTLGDVNGPRGGRDKSCRVDVHVRGVRMVRAKALAGDGYAALDLAIHRTGRGVARALDREQAALVELSSISSGAASGWARR